MAVASLPVEIELTNSTGNPIRYTCASGVAIPKYSVLTLSDPNTAAAVTATPTAAGLIFAGIASMAKDVTDDTSTEIAAFTDGIFKLEASGAIVVGQPIMSCGANEFCLAPNTASGALIAGYAKETAADTETFRARILI